MTELINRSLVQVLEVRSWGEVAVCGIHDLLREVILQKMKDLSFCLCFVKRESSFEGLT